MLKENNITYIKLGEDFNQHIDNQQISFSFEKKEFTNRKNKFWLIKYSYLPNSLTRLELGFDFDQPINNLPNSLNHLLFSFGSHFNQQINYLPSNLKYLVFNAQSFFNQPINYLPNNLRYLILGNAFNQRINNLHFKFFPRKKF
jgi:hypothetical protein